MKNIVVLIDTNVLLDIIEKREGFVPACQLLSLCVEKRINGYIAFHSLSTIWYVLRKNAKDLRRAWLRRICAILTVTGARHEDVLQASISTRTPLFHTNN